MFVANGALSLLNLCIYLLDRQIRSQAETFEHEGGFTERLYHRRSATRQHRAHHGFAACHASGIVATHTFGSPSISDVKITALPA